MTDSRQPSFPKAMPLMLAALCATGPLGIDMYLPSIPDMAVAMHADEGAIQLSLMTFFIGLMLGQLVYGPLSDKFGRKPLISAGLVVFILGGIGCALSATIEQLHVLRFVQGVGGSIGLVISFAIVKDAFTGAAFGKMLALVLAVLGISPVAAPMVGSLLQSVGNWRTIFWALSLYGAVLLVVLAVYLPETRQPEARRKTKLSRTAHNYWHILVDQRFLPFALTLCIGQAGFFAYLAGSASVFISEFGLTPTQFSLLFGVNALGLVAASILTPRLHAALGELASFKRLIVIYLLVMAALSAYVSLGGNNMWVLSVGLFVVVASLGFIMPTGSQLALLHQHQMAGTASALLGGMEFGFGAIVSAITGGLASHGSLGLLLVMTACAALAALMCWLSLPQQVLASTEGSH